MTIASPVSSASFAGNGVTVSFPLPFRFVSTADVAVVLRGADGSETLLTETADYTLSGAGEASGGACALASPPLPGQTLVFTRAPRILQETDYQENDAFPAESHEAALDLLTMICQALDERLGRAALLPVSCGLRRPVLAEPAPGRALVWDQDGRVLGPGPSAADIASAQGFAEAAAAARDAARGFAEAAAGSAASMEPPSAGDIPFDNAGSGLAGTDVQAALDELAAQAVEPSDLDRLRALLLAEALRRAIGDSVDGREFLGNGWIDPLADGDEVAVSGGGSFVSADGGFLTNAGAEDHVTALDLATARFLDEKGGIAAFTVDTASTSGHFDAPVNARIKAGCRMVLSNGGVHPIVGIAGDGTAANSVVFTGARAANTFGVSAIHGCEPDGGALRLSRAETAPSYGHALSSGDRTASITVAANFTPQLGTPDAWVDGATGNNAADSWAFPAVTAANKTVTFTFPYPVVLTEATLHQDKTTEHGTWKWQGHNGTAWVDIGGTFTLGGALTQALTSLNGNTTACAQYRLIGTAGTMSQSPYLQEITFKVGTLVHPAGVTYPLSLAVDCTDWTALTALARAETLNSQSIWYALSFDGGTTYSAFVSSAWLPIVRNNGGAWEYWTGAAWTNATPDSALGAMAQAAGVAGNRMTGAAMAGLSQAQIEGSGGFTGGQTSLPVLAALHSASSAATPALSGVTLTSDIQARDAVFEFDAFEASGPDQAKVALVLQAVDDVALDADLRAWVRRGEEAYAQVPLAVDSAFDASRVLVAGDLPLSGGGTATRLKITCHNHKELRIHAAANCFRSA